MTVVKKASGSGKSGKIGGRSKSKRSKGRRA